MFRIGYLRLISFFAAFAISAVGFAQDQMGIMGSSRSPIQTVRINPSNLVDSRAFLDIQLIGADVFAMNDFAYLHGFSLKKNYFDTLSTVQLHEQRLDYSAFASVAVRGPSVAFAVKGHGFAVQTAVRSVTDARGLPDELYPLIASGMTYRGPIGQMRSIENMRVNSLTWGELGLSYATILRRSGNDLWLGGITVKKLYGIAGAGVRVDHWDYTMVDSSNLETHRFVGEYGFNDPTQNPLSGRGTGFDIGITWKRRLSDSKHYIPHDPCTDGDYLFKLGASILDLGRISFYGPSYRNLFNQNESTQWDNFAGTEVSSLSQVDSLINSNFRTAMNNGQDGRFRMKLPTAISIQGDFRLHPQFYIFGSVLYGLPRMMSLGVQRTSSLSIVPRWETKRLEVSVPMTAYGFRKPMIGLCMRLNNVVIGSDHLGWLFGQRNLFGADFYMSVKITVFKHWKCKSIKDLSEAGTRHGTQPAKRCATWH